MLSFECDYNKGAHKKILERLLETNEEPAKGYGFDHTAHQRQRRF